MAWLIMPTIGSCISTPTLPPGLTAVPIEIKEPVGVGSKARNKGDDVRVIQEALNRVTVEGEPGGPMPFLKVDGICGPKTNAAISRFQQVQLKIFDGLVEPKRKTIIRLNEIIKPVAQVDVDAKISAALPIAAAALQAAIANVEAAISGNPSALAAVATDRLNRHFRMNTLPAEQAALARVDMFRSYLRWQTVVTNPESFGEKVFDQFDFDGSDPLIALTTGDGFFHPLETKDGARMDRMHLGLGFMSPSVTPEFAAYVMLHEVTHFVNRSDRVDIEDHGRGWFDDPFIKPLPADKRLTNADSYATFALECRQGNPSRPPFVKSSPGGLGGRR